MNVNGKIFLASFNFTPGVKEKLFILKTSANRTLNVVDAQNLLAGIVDQLKNSCLVTGDPESVESLISPTQNNLVSVQFVRDVIERQIRACGFDTDNDIENVRLLLHQWISDAAHYLQRAELAECLCQ